jgi:hypothetical protein
VRDAYLDVKGGYHVSATPHPLALQRGLPVDLGRGTGLAVAVSQWYRLIETADRRTEPWKVTTVAYSYTLSESDGPEIFAYHWHPTTPNSVHYPHLHLEHGAQLGRQEFHSAHLPTGRVSLEDFVQLIIESFGVSPVRNNWEALLEESRAEFDAERSW